MRYIIVSAKAGTYVGTTYGGDFFSEFYASTYTDTACTFPSEGEAREFAERFLADDDDVGELTYLPVDSADEQATMAECVAAGAAPWRHHVARGPRIRSTEPLQLPQGFYGVPGYHRASFSSSLLTFLNKDQRVVAFDLDKSLRLACLHPAVGASLLVHFTDDEMAALNEWCAAQPGGTQGVGAADLMQWPGWEAVASRRASASANSVKD
jgi:hypothetical protein